MTHGASSTAIVPWLVASGLGVGVAIGISQLLNPAGVRGLPLPGAAPVTVGAHYAVGASPALRAFLEAAGETARVLLAAEARDMSPPTAATAQAVPKTTLRLNVRPVPQHAAGRNGQQPHAGTASKPRGMQLRVR